MVRTSLNTIENSTTENATSHPTKREAMNNKIKSPRAKFSDRNKVKKDEIKKKVDLKEQEKQKVPEE